MDSSAGEGKPLPTPRPRLSRNSNEQYENYKLPNRDVISLGSVKELNCPPPVPAPRIRVKTDDSTISVQAAPLNNLNEPSSQKPTGAIRKVPNVKNNLESETSVHMHSDDKKSREFDVISQTSSGSVKSGGDAKFHTPSPGEIIKSIGSSSKMLRESIGERVSEKTSSAKHKILKEYKNTKNVVDTWASDSKFSLRKSLQSTLGNMSLKKRKKKGREHRSSSMDQDIDQVDLAGNKMFHESLSFKSPVSSTYSLEPSNLPPTYDEVIKSNFPRQTNITRSLNNIMPKLSRKESTDLNISDDSDDDDETVNKKVVPEVIYGKIKKLPDSSYENILVPNIIPASSPELVASDVATFRESFNSDRSFDGISTMNKSINSNDVSDRSVSWRYCEQDASLRSSGSDETNEPIYANNEIEQMKLDSVNNNSEMSVDDIMAPMKVTQSSADGRQSNTLTSEILREFDPLSRESFDAFIMKKINHLSLLETLLSEETYGISENVKSDVTRLSRNSQSASAKPCESEKKSSDVPEKPLRKSKTRTHDPLSVIIHQNPRLKDSIENLTEPIIAAESSTKEKTTNWYIDDENNATSASNNLDNPNFYVPKSSDKVFKSVQLTEVNDFPQNNLYPNLKPQGITSNDNDDERLYPILPSYEDSKNDEVVASNLPDASSKTRSFFNFGRKLMSSSSKENKHEIVNYIQKPPLVNDSPKITNNSSILFKLPSGVIEDILKELSPRFVVFRNRQFNAFSDKEFRVLKEHLDLSNLTSIQYLVNHKFSEFKTEAGRQIYCFELNLSVPKQMTSAAGNQDIKAAMMKNQRVTFVYGIHNKKDKCLWMQNIIRSVTDVFPDDYTMSFSRAGWCYAKKSISQQWFSTWLMLSRRKLIFYDYNEAKLEILDLRKARYIGWKDSDESINQLLVEKSSTIFVDCPPFTCYFTMMSERETKNWNLVIKDEAYANGAQLCHQQLTKDNVPVIIDKCINFVYTHGTMSEGIYRKEGSSSNIQKLMAALKKDAFEVQITRSEYNEHDACSVLKRFLRDLPEPVMGKYAAHFLSAFEIDNAEQKIKTYRELLRKLPVVEYKTLKKLLGHLHFVQTQSGVNKMQVENLGMIFGPTLMQPTSNNENVYTMDSRHSSMIADLIRNYKKLYDLSEDEIKKEQIMLSVLQKYHLAAENLSDTVKQSGDFKIWITLDRNPEINMKQEDKKQVNMIITPLKTVHELCKEMESHMGMPAYQMCLFEVILNGELQRPIHYNEKLLNIVLRWANWPDDDRKDNYLELRPKSKFVQQVERAMKTLPSFTPCMELKFADRKIKSMKPFTLELDGSTLNVLKPQKQTNVKVKDVDLANCIVYIGAEKKRESQMRWVLTFVELNFTKRSRESPYIGYVIAGNNLTDQITWYTSIMYSMHGPDIVANPEIVIP